MRALILDNGDVSEDISPFLFADTLQTSDYRFSNQRNIIVITM